MTEMTRLARGLHRPVSAVAHEIDRSAAMLGVLPADGVISDISAGRLLGLWLPPSGKFEPMCVTLGARGGTARMRAHSVRPELRVRRRQLDTDDVVSVGGVPVTSACRTWIDLAQTLPIEDLVAAGDSVLRLGANPALLAKTISAARSHRGVVRARQASMLLDARSRSRMESLLRVGLVLRGLLKPEVNVPVYDEFGQWLAEPDLSYDDARLALKYNGADHAELRRMRRDMTREIDLRERGGWQTIGVGPAQVLGQMDRVAALTRRLRDEGRRPRSPLRRVAG